MTETPRRADPTALASPRFWEIDAVRGVAIAMMVLYHLVYDLDQFGGHDLGATTGGWRLFADATAFLFVFLVGVSLIVSHDRARRAAGGTSALFRKVALRGARILAYGLLITLVVEVAVPGGHIWFGILHVIGVAIVLAYPFLGRPWPALFGAIVVVLANPVVQRLDIDGPWLLWLGVRGDVGSMLDYRPLVPWFGVVLLGIAAGSVLYRDGRRRFPWSDQTPLPPTRLLILLGRHSLLIYLVHQPVLIGALLALGLIGL